MTFNRITLKGGVLGLSLLLAGCIELTNNAAFRANGEVHLEVEIALSAEVVALITNPAFAKQMGGGGGMPNLFGDCGKPWPAKEPMPEGVRSIESRRGKRGDMETCTLVLDIADPVVALEAAKKIEVTAVEKMPKQDVSLVRLDGASGYRFRMAMTPAQSPDVPPEAAQAMAALMQTMFADRYLTLSLSGQRIENTNGELTPDKRKVTWRLPLASMAAPTPDRIVTVEADVIYR